jgi:hypothetical protein
VTHVAAKRAGFLMLRRSARAARTEVPAREVGVRGLLNVQYALAGGILYVLEANPRASRTVPFVSKATAVPLDRAATRIMLGATIAELRTEGLLAGAGDGGTLPLDAPIAVKEAVLPFGRFRDAAGDGVDTLLGPEMRSTGEVMDLDDLFGTAYAKSQAAAYGALPVKGRAFVSVASKDKRAMIFPVKRLADLGFEIWATSGTCEILRRNGVPATIVREHSDGRGPDGEPTIVERILAGQVDLVINTPFGAARAGTVREGTVMKSERPPCAGGCRAHDDHRAAAVVRGIEARQERGGRAVASAARGAPAASRGRPARGLGSSWAASRRFQAMEGSGPSGSGVSPEDRTPGEQSVPLGQHWTARHDGRRVGIRPDAGARHGADGAPGGGVPRHHRRRAGHRRAVQARPVRGGGGRRI